jgi:hypothetical protein
MPINPSTEPRGNIQGNWILSVTLSPSSVANATTAEQTFTCTGLALGDFVDVAKPTVQGGLGIVNSRVSAPGVLAIGFSNSTAATITPTPSEVYQVSVTRPENLASNVSTLTSVPT